MNPPRFSLVDIAAIALGGILGSLLRTWVGTGYEGSFPVPTLLVNILGAAALAILHATQHRIHQKGKYLYMVGFCGSFTTVSLFSVETVGLFRDGEPVAALANLLLPVVIAVGLAFWIVSRFDRQATGGRS